VGFVAIWTEIGVAPALIHRQETDEDVLHTAWLLSAGRGALLGAGAFLCAGPIAAFFNTPALVPIVRAMAFTFVGYGICSMGLVLLRRELDFRKLAYVELGSEACSFVTGVAAALILRNAWALVLAVLSKVFVVLVASYLVHPYRPRIRWRGAAAKGLASYGVYVLGAGVVHYLLSQGDNAVVGKVLGAAELGLYGLAYNLAHTPATSISNVIAKVAFPVYARLQHDSAALRDAYLRVLRVTASLAVPALAGIMALAPVLVRVLYGLKWMPMVVPLTILCVGGLERAVTSPVAPLFNAMGKPKIVFFLVTGKLLLFGAGIFPLTARYGILGTAIAGAAVSVILLACHARLVAWLLRCRAADVLRVLAGPFAAAGLMAGSLLLLRLSGWFEVSFASLGMLIVVGAVVYLVGLYALDRSAIGEIRRLLWEQTGAAEAAAVQATEPAA
jgi:PST family polysaccharide transporter/lipopolysaccharide exporter